MNANFVMETKEVEADFTIDNTIVKESGTSNHSELTNRDSVDQHPIEAITGLKDILDGPENDESQLGDQVLVIQGDVNTLKLTSATKEELSALDNKVDSLNIPSHEDVEQIKKDLESVDLTNYALKTEIPTKISQLTNDSNFLTEHQSLANYATQDDLMAKADSADMNNVMGDVVMLQADKLDRNLGLVNAGKYLYVGNDGNVITKTVETESYTSVVDRYGIKADYALTYGITDCPNGLIEYGNDKEITIKPGVVLRMAGSDSATTIASSFTYEIEETGKVTLFFTRTTSSSGTIQIGVLEAGDVFYQEEEPQNGVSSFLAWWQPSKKMWQFKSNYTGNVWREAISTPFANVNAGETRITSINYIGYRIINDDIFAQLSDIENLQTQIQSLLTRIEVLENK